MNLIDTYYLVEEEDPTQAQTEERAIHYSGLCSSCASYLWRTGGTYTKYIVPGERIDKDVSMRIEYHKARAEYSYHGI